MNSRREVNFFSAQKSQLTSIHTLLTMTHIISSTFRKMLSLDPLGMEYRASQYSDVDLKLYQGSSSLSRQRGLFSRDIDLLSPDTQIRKKINNPFASFFITSGFIMNTKNKRSEKDSILKCFYFNFSEGRKMFFIIQKFFPNHLFLNIFFRQKFLT